MAAASTLSAVAYAMKKLYSGKEPESLATRKRVFFSQVRKEDGFTGDGTFNVPVQYGNPQGVSASIANAITYASSSKGIRWAIDREKMYGVCTLDGEFIAATKNDKGSFIRGLKNEVDMMLDEMGHRTAVHLYGDGSGSIGRRASLSSNTVTLSVVDDAKHFAVGMYVVASDTLSGGSLRSGSTYVTAVDEDLGKVTLNSAAGISSFTDNDYIYPIGDYDNAIKGLAAWLPLTAPVLASDSFFGVDRGVDPGRLAGWRLDSTSASIEENAITLAAKINRAGGRPDALFLNPPNWATLAKALGTKVEREAGGTAEMSFAHVVLATPAGMVKVYADPECPSNRGYMLEMSTWFVKHLEGLPHIVMDDGNDAIRVSAEDSIEIRARQWANLVCVAPGKNGVFAI